MPNRADTTGSGGSLAGSLLGVELGGTGSLPLELRSDGGSALLSVELGSTGPLPLQFGTTRLTSRFGDALLLGDARPELGDALLLGDARPELGDALLLGDAGSELGDAGLLCSSALRLFTSSCISRSWSWSSSFDGLGGLGAGGTRCGVDGGGWYSDIGESSLL